MTIKCISIWFLQFSNFLLCIYFQVSSDYLRQSFVTIRKFGNMTAENLDQIPNVDIDPEGRFKYILIQVIGKNASDNSELSKLIVRGYSRAQWHSKFIYFFWSNVQWRY